MCKIYYKGRICKRLDYVNIALEERWDPDNNEFVPLPESKEEKERIIRRDLDQVFNDEEDYNGNEGYEILHVGGTLKEFCIDLDEDLKHMIDVDALEFNSDNDDCTESVAYYVFCLNSVKFNPDPVEYHFGFKGDAEYYRFPEDWDSEMIKELSYLSLIRKMIDEGKRQFVLTGAPGTGKTFAVNKMAEENNMKYGLTSRRDYFVQFHPSYDYVDFVEGIRPVQEGRNKMQFVKRDGIFKSFCRKVIELTNNDTGEDLSDVKYFFVIDEINRADLSKVFGELMYCLEESKRGKENQIATQYQNLPTYGIKDDEDVFRDGFYIPDNVIIVGTMNDIDRSVDTFDFALRRRFTWIEVGGLDTEDTEDYKNYLKEVLYGMGKSPDCIFRLTERLTALNTYIIENGAECGLDGRYIIGPAYFDKFNEENDFDVELNECWTSRIKPLIEEYCRGQKRAKEFVISCGNAFLEE